MSFTISDVTKKFYLTPGHKHHYNLDCTYKLTEANKAVFLVTRKIFRDVKEGYIGRKGGSQMRVVKPEFVTKLHQWEQVDHGKASKDTSYKVVISKVLISAAPAPKAAPPVNPMLPAIQLMQKQIVELTNQVNSLKTSLAQEKANNANLTVQLRQTQTQLANLVAALNILLG